MKILVTGAKGQVGFELVSQAQLLGYQVIGTDRDQLDITDEQAVISFINYARPDVIINAAAYTSVDLAESEGALAYAVNAEAVKYLSAVAKLQNIPLLHISTDYVFDGTKSGAYVEEDPVIPVNLYGASKRKGEEYLEQSGVKYINLRTSWVFGLQGNNFVKTMIRLAKARDEFGVVDDQIGGPTFAADIAATLLNIAQKTQDSQFEQWGTYHYSGMPYVTWWEFADYITQKAFELGVIATQPKINKLTTDQYPTPANRPKRSCMDLTKVQNTFELNGSDWAAAVCKLLECNINKYESY